MNLPVLLSAAAAAGLGWWGWDLWRRPYKRCWSCKGTGRVAGSTSRRYGLCTRCEGGRKRYLRVGARWVRPKLRRK